MKGFTLLELIVVITITAVLAVGGIAAYIQYSRIQALNSAVSGLNATLQLAKSKAQSQVKPIDGLCSAQTLQGYKVTIDPSTNSYGLSVVCGDSASPIAQQIGQWQKVLPNNSCFSCRSSNSFFFRAITGAVEFENPAHTTGTISVNAFGAEKTVTVGGGGVLQLGGTCPQAARTECATQHSLSTTPTATLAHCADLTDDQVYSSSNGSMVGCDGTRYPSRASDLCKSGSHVCSLDEYISRGGKTVEPTRTRWLATRSREAVSCTSNLCGSNSCDILLPSSGAPGENYLASTSVRSSYNVCPSSTNDLIYLSLLRTNELGAMCCSD